MDPVGNVELLRTWATRFICQPAETGSDIPLSALNTLVSEAIDVVVHTDRTRDGLRVRS